MAGKLNGYSKLITITTLILLVLGAAFGAFSWLSSRISDVRNRSDAVYAGKNTTVALKEAFSDIKIDVRSLQGSLESLRLEQKEDLEKVRMEQREEFRILSNKLDEMAKVK